MTSRTVFSLSLIAIASLAACGRRTKSEDAGADATVADAAVGASASATPAPSPPIFGDCAALEKTFMERCQDTCAAKLKEKSPEKTDAERRLFCESGCTSQMLNSPRMARCRGK